MLSKQEELEWQWELLILDLMDASKKALIKVGTSAILNLKGGK